MAAQQPRNDWGWLVPPRSQGHPRVWERGWTEAWAEGGGGGERACSTWPSLLEKGAQRFFHGGTFFPCCGQLMGYAAVKTYHAEALRPYKDKIWSCKGQRCVVVCGRPAHHNYRTRETGSSLIMTFCLCSVIVWSIIILLVGSNEATVHRFQLGSLSEHFKL